MAWGIDWACPSFVAGFRSGDAAVLAALYSEYFSDLKGVARSGFVTGSRPVAYIPGIPNQDERADLIQDVFARAFSPRARLRFDTNRAYRPYLLAICRHALVDWHRTRRQRHRLETSLRESMCCMQFDEITLAKDSGLDTLLDAYLGTLDRRRKDVFQQIIVLGRSQCDAAATLGLSRQNVRTLERRVRAGLSRALRPSRR